MLLIKAIKKIRLVDNELGTHSAILADLQGPKIRIGDMPEDGLQLKNEEDFYLTTLKDHDYPLAAQIFIEQIPKDVKKGEKVNAKQAIGEVFTNQQTGKTQLQFGIFNNVKALNPKDWVYQM